MEDNKENNENTIAFKFVMYIAVVIALIYFLKGVIKLINDDFYERLDANSLIASSVVLIVFMWYSLVLKKK
jgi:uncharacterized protein with PQ loop repeat